VKTTRRVLVAGAMVATGATLSGCLISGSSHSKQTGAYVSPSTFNQVEPGVTTEEWVLASFGQPTSRSQISDGSEILKWAYTQTKSGSGSVFLLYGGSNSSEKQGAAFVQIRDGVVIKAWRD
jgi:outer membrane protein assembly factor BamE (lipoprotein component of BamABCDE complex)